MEKTLVIIKPDAVKRGLIGKIIDMYEQKELKITKMKMLTATEGLLSQHYQEHVGKSFYENLIQFMQSGPRVVMCVEGDAAVELVRKINGATDYMKADGGSIRGHYAHGTTENCVHGSDSVESAQRELAIWFGDET